jgi:hypothetical protein
MLVTLMLLVTEPTVHVRALERTDVQSVRLRGWVAARLVQERYTVVPEADAAQWTITVEHAPEGWRLEVRGGEVARETIAHGEDGIERLELLHRTVEALERVPPTTPSPRVEPPPRLRVSIAEPSDAGEGGALESQVAAVVLDRGLALSGMDGAADANLCVSRIAEGMVRVAVGSSDASCETSMEGAASVSLDELGVQLPLLLPQAVTSEEPPMDADPETVAFDSPAPVAKVAESPRAPAAKTPRRIGRWADPGRVLRVAVAGGLVSRVRPVDGAVGAHVRFGREPGLGVRVDVDLWPSLHDAVRVVETAPSVGLDGRVISTDLLALDIGMLVGPVVHSYAVTGGARGSRVDWNLTLPVALSFRIVAGLEGSIGLRLGRAGRARSHVINGEEVWARDSWRIGVMLGLAWQWRLR